MSLIKSIIIFAIAIGISDVIKKHKQEYENFPMFSIVSPIISPIIDNDCTLRLSIVLLIISFS